MNDLNVCNEYMNLKYHLNNLHIYWNVMLDNHHHY